MSYPGCLDHCVDRAKAHLYSVLHPCPYCEIDRLRAQVEELTKGRDSYYKALGDAVAENGELTQDREALQDAIKTVSGEDETGINYLVAAALDTGRERDDLYVEVQQARQETAREIRNRIVDRLRAIGRLMPASQSLQSTIDEINEKYGIKEDVENEANR